MIWDTKKNCQQDLQQALDEFTNVKGFAFITLNETVHDKKIEITVHRIYKNYSINPGESYLDIYDKFIIFGGNDGIPLFPNITYKTPFNNVEYQYNTKHLKLTVVSQSETEFVVTIEKV